MLILLHIFSALFIIGGGHESGCDNIYDIFVNIEEYKPFGIYEFNNKFFYFDQYGKIIQEINNEIKNDNLLIFFGQSSNIKAKIIIEILVKLNFKKKFKIKKIFYVEKRRWDILLTNNIKLMLSETSPLNSLINFINLKSCYGMSFQSHDTSKIVPVK